MTKKQPKPRKLSPKQKKFVQEYEKTGNGQKSYQKIYKVSNQETAKVNASRLLTKANVAEYKEKVEAKVEAKAIISAEEIARAMLIIARNNEMLLVAPHQAVALKALQGLSKMLGYDAPVKNEVTVTTLQDVINDLTK